MSRDPEGMVRALVDAAREGPSPDEVGRLRARLVPQLQPPPPATPASPASSGAGLVGMVLLVGSLAAGGAAFLALRAEPEPAPGRPHQVREAPLAAPAAPAVSEPVSSAPPAPLAPRRIRPRSHGSTPEGAVSPAPLAPATAVALVAPPAPPAAVPEGPDEVALLREAQDLIHSSPQGSLARVAEHERRFPNGVLTQEREVIAVEALVRVGHHAAARTRADRFLARYPRSALRRKVEELLERAAP